MELSIQTDEANDALYLAFTGRALDRGIVKKSVAIGENIVLDFDERDRLIGMDVMNASRVFGSSIRNIRIDQLVGVAEAAELVGVKKPNFLRDYANQPDFPGPAVELASGRFWLKSLIQNYLLARQARRRA